MLPEQDSPEILVPFVKPLELCNVGEKMTEPEQLQEGMITFKFQLYVQINPHLE